MNNLSCNTPVSRPKNSEYVQEYKVAKAANLAIKITGLVLLVFPLYILIFAYRTCFGVAKEPRRVKPHNPRKKVRRRIERVVEKKIQPLPQKKIKRKKIHPPTLEFGIQKRITCGELASLKIPINGICSTLPQYADSYFDSELTDGCDYLITRHKLPGKGKLTEALKSIEHEDCLLKAKEIRAIGETLLGLRHVTGLENAQIEVWDGMKSGCSLNICFQKANGNKNKFEGLHKKSDEEIGAQLESYNKGISEFILNSFDMDLSNKKHTLKDVFEHAKGSCFLFIRYDNSGSIVDTEKWGEGLGRFSKSDQNSVGLLDFNKKIDNLEVSEELGNMEVIGHDARIEVFNFLTKYVLKSMKEEIHRLPQPQSTL